MDNNLKFELTPEQKRGILNIATRNIVNWMGRKLFNISQILCQNLTTARLNVIERNQRIVIDAVNGLTIYDNANNPILQCALNPVTGANPTGLKLWHNGSQLTVSTDATGVPLYLK